MKPQMSGPSAILCARGSSARRISVTSFASECSSDDTDSLDSAEALHDDLARMNEHCRALQRAAELAFAGALNEVARSKPLTLHISTAPCPRCGLRDRLGPGMDRQRQPVLYGGAAAKAAHEDTHPVDTERKALESLVAKQKEEIRRLKAKLIDQTRKAVSLEWEFANLQAECAQLKPSLLPRHAARRRLSIPASPGLRLAMLSIPQPIDDFQLVRTRMHDLSVS